ETRLTDRAPKRPRWMAVGAVAVVVVVSAAAVTGTLIHRSARPAEIPLTITGAPASMNPEANDAFALAMQFLRVQNDIVRGRQQLERALALDPHFAEARRYHAFNYVLQLLNGMSNDPSLLYKAEEELREAERENPSLVSLPSAFAAVYLTQ